MVARLIRMIPLLVVLAVVAAAVYLIAAWRFSPNRAKEILIKWFTVITLALTAFFALFTLYALAEGNAPVFDLAFSFALACAVCLAIVRLCRWRFVKNHPSWAQKPQRAKVKRRFPWSK